MIETVSDGLSSNKPLQVKGKRRKNKQCILWLLFPFHKETSKLYQK